MNIDNNINDGLAYSSTKRKIGFFSAMLVVIGSSIGAGIFFKAGTVLQNSAHSVIFAIFCWIIAAFAVICMSLALIEIASARNDNLSIIGWCKTFNKRIIYKACKNFMLYIYSPLTFFFMPLYVVMAIQDGASGFNNNIVPNLGGHQDWTIAMVITILMTVYFLFVSGLSSKAANIQNWIILSVKFLPLIFAMIIGFVIVAKSGFQNNNQIGNGIDFVPSNNNNDDDLTFNMLTPGIGMFISIAGIFFAYDGFYVAAGIQTELKEPKKTPIAILIGMIIVTIIYLSIAISMSIASSEGNPMGLKSWLQQYTSINNVNWLYGLFQILIGIGALGIINGFAMWTPRFIEDLIKSGEIPFSLKLLPKVYKNKVPLVGVLYILILSLPIIILFSIIGGLGYTNTSNYEWYGTGMQSLYSFADLMSTWTSIIAFCFIIFAIGGGLKNRKTNLVKVQKNKYFIPMAILSIITVSIPLFFTLTEPIFNIFLLYRCVYNKQAIIAKIMSLITLILFLLFTFLPTVIEDSINKKKFGSLYAYELWKNKKLSIIYSNK